MSKHDLKGLDTGKIGNNKNIDLSFSEYMDVFGGGAKKKEIPELTDLQQLEDFYGPNAGIPGLGKTIDQLKVELQPVGLPKDTKVLGDGTILPKDAPTGINRAVAGFLDRVLRDTTDFDKRGVEGEGLGKIDLDDLSKYKLLPDQQNKLNTALEQTIGIDPDPTSTMKEGLESYLDFKKAGDTQSRKGRVLDSALEFLNYSLTSPKIINDLKDVSTFKQQQLLDAEAIKQGLPNAQQARMLAASTGFANEAQAVAAQQDAATRFAGLGMQRRFG